MPEGGKNQQMPTKGEEKFGKKQAKIKQILGHKAFKNVH
jgi:hypothetical protein